MFKKLLKKSVHRGVTSELRQPLLHRKDYEPFQDREGCEISEETAPVAHLSPTDVKVGNVSGGVLQDGSEGELRDWCNLPDGPLLSILERLTSLGDFFAFSHVCREWRSVSEVRKMEYMATQPPLVCANLSYGGFYSWKEERLYKKEVLKVKGEKIAGFSHGFLISLRFKHGEAYFALVNPVTGVEVMARFPVLPKCVSALIVTQRKTKTKIQQALRSFNKPQFSKRIIKLRNIL
ncbi:hypothetical protein QJS04_geneDACA019339 [Acorus gramineus]|uniref:F-box domain-containing protein n=1 Tax=Acorus gramineus TaxID=55184 RepID=A0AAV9ARB0_ACOGR|nr:hypothetical protein QJS04_geneDACA019339 [Acorus gramineus]